MSELLTSEFRYLHRGKDLTIRWVKPEDKVRLELGLSMMSDEGLYQRFFMPIKELSDAQLEYFTNVDQIDHVAWGILDNDNPLIPGLGIARFVRLEDEIHIAEAAVTIPDGFQGIGYGTLLLAVLNMSAATKNITHLRSIVLNSNEGFIQLLKSLGGEITPEEDESSVRIDTPVYSSAEDIPLDVRNKHFHKHIVRLSKTMPSQKRGS